ncbi:MAG: hypothetical protein QOC96_2335 [Acidobacteriota bacterium]|jgi:hypothetical protein|nr:hypothetical protein [Acidobacteriota bacterium]
MSLLHVALVSEDSSISFQELTTVSAALQKQVLQDYSPIWGINATVNAFHSLNDVPVGTWPIVIMDDIGEPGAEGVHEDKDGHPIALVTFDDGWTLTASHECIEMLTDPDGNRTMPGLSPKKNQGKVEFLVEPCDPSEDTPFAYKINNVLVSDFYTPHYFEPVVAPGVKYSFTGAITKPRQVLKGGYLSWHDPVSDHWWQETYFGSRRRYVNLGVLGRMDGSFRSQINRRTKAYYKKLEPTGKELQETRAMQKSVNKSSVSKAEVWRQRIKELTGKK